MSELTDRLRSDSLSDYWMARREAADLIDAIEAAYLKATDWTDGKPWCQECALDHDIYALLHPESD